jgi:alpha-L-fucosidase
VKTLNTYLSAMLLVGLLWDCSSYDQPESKYEPNWRSLRRIQIPKWLQDGKFGIYTHWGIYSVSAYGENVTWYPRWLYAAPNSVERAHFEKTFGTLDKIGFKDLIPMFTADKFDADEWADLFKKSGACFAGPVAEHHDGFAMWDTKYSDWNAAKMGPKRDVVGELEKAIKARGMKYVTTFHHAGNWFFFPVWDERYDTGNPKYEGLYGQAHEQGAMRNQEFLNEWYGKLVEVIDNYSPDFIWFDFALDEIAEGYVKDFLAYYYNHGLSKNKEVVVTYKGHDLVPGSGVRDLELGQEPNLTYNEWITDNSVDATGAWGYADNLTYKTPNRLVDNLIDRVSKNGYLLLNVGPKPDGSIPEGAKEALLGIGEWLNVNGEAVYGTTPWMIAGEGPTNIGSGPSALGFNESDVKYTAKDIRFTVNDDDIYATFLDWPGDVAVITSLYANGLNQETPELPDWVSLKKSAPLAGKIFDDIWWDTDEDIEDIQDTPFRFEFFNETEFRVTGGEAGDGFDGTYEQVDKTVYLKMKGNTWKATYDGNEFSLGGDELPG